MQFQTIYLLLAYDPIYDFSGMIIYWTYMIIYGGIWFDRIIWNQYDDHMIIQTYEPIYDPGFRCDDISYLVEYHSQNIFNTPLSKDSIPQKRVSNLKNFGPMKCWKFWSSVIG